MGLQTPDELSRSRLGFIEKMGVAKGLKTRQKRIFSGSFRSRVLNIQDEDEVVKSPRACYWKEHEISNPTVKDKQEKDNNGTKPDKNGKRGKPRQCQNSVTIKKAEKAKKI
uniref:Uncharacterized protein n=1 Tax=Tanacetum cinerariifolium TaxID=118510 RepID=A0A6L2L5G3_TANCI|nr:hypothetical protein [Tanacetum cinerariifolium]